MCDVLDAFRARGQNGGHLAADQIVTFPIGFSESEVAVVAAYSIATCHDDKITWYREVVIEVNRS